MVTNTEFLSALFAEDMPWVHVTDFPYDPNNIPKDKHLAAWKGDYFSRYRLTQGYNQYFTISNFYADENGQARRRKALYRHTRVIVLDDVKEKLALEQVQKLPPPAWILETSPGSEQWGYILDTPCTDRAKVENLLDGLVANGLAPDGRDPGMKGVTRYVRLPEGSNSKASKLVNGQPFPCRLTSWEPFNRVSIEQLAAPFQVNLEAPRREQRVDGAAAVSDHPLLQIPDIIRVKEVRSDGRFDITCPWVREHTNQEDSGSAIFTNADGSIGFKCHHGNCQEKTGQDLLRYIDGQSPGFSTNLRNWQILRDFSSIALSKSNEEISFITQDAPTPTTSAATEELPPIDAIQSLCDQLRRINTRTEEARNVAAAVLKYTDSLPKLEQIHHHEQLRDLMGWSKAEIKDILKSLREQWYGEKISTATFYDGVVYVKALNQFYDWRARIFFTPDAFQNSFGHEDAEARKIALQDGRVMKVDTLDYAPKYPRIFEEDGKVIGNTWVETQHGPGVQGDISRWYDHFDQLGWGEYRKHIIQWMAFTLRHPEIKINHMLLLGSGEGCGKDFLLYPLSKAMGDDHTVMSGEELLEGFHDYLLSTKYLHINEAELGDRREAIAVSSKLKPMAASPPETLRVNQKGIKPIKIRNIVSLSMTTNSPLPVRINSASRRMFCVWSDLNPRDEFDNMKKEWREYWEDRWNWIRGTNQFSQYSPGWKSVLWHLLNEVDLSDFNPGEAPPVTDFLRDIRDASKSPMLTTIETFIKKKTMLFKCDLLTSTDMAEALKAGAAFAPGDMYTDSKYFTPTRIGVTLRESGQYKQFNAYDNGHRVRLWAVRNIARYEAMDSSDLYKEYQAQLKTLQGEPLIKEVK